jgi:hypothetical protein
MKPASSLSVLLLTAPLATAQFGADDILSGNWKGTFDAVQQAADGTLRQTFAGAKPGALRSPTVTGEGLVLMGRTGTGIAGYVLFDGAGNLVTEVDVPYGSDDIWDTGQYSSGEYVLLNRAPMAVIIYGQDHQVVNVFWDPTVDSTGGMFVDDQDHVWITQTSPGMRVLEFNPQGVKVQSFTINFHAGDIVRAPDGTLWIIGSADGRVRHLQSDGTPLGDWPTLAVGNFSRAIGLFSTGTLVVGAVNHDDLYLYDQSGAYLGALPDHDPGGNTLSISIVPGEDLGTAFCGPANLNSSGQAAELAAFGLPPAAMNNVRLDATQMAVNQFGFFLNSTTQGFVQPPGSQGNLCLGGAIGRYSASVLSTGPAGEFSLQLDLTQTPRPGGNVAIQPGETWLFQGWFRDQNPGNTSNFTDGLSVTFQ